MKMLNQKQNCKLNTYLKEMKEHKFFRNMNATYSKPWSKKCLALSCIEEVIVWRRINVISFIINFLEGKLCTNQKIAVTSTQLLFYLTRKCHHMSIQSHNHRKAIWSHGDPYLPQDHSWKSRFPILHLTAFLPRILTHIYRYIYLIQDH